MEHRLFFVAGVLRAIWLAFFLVFAHVSSAPAQPTMAAGSAAGITFELPAGWAHRVVSGTEMWYSGDPDRPDAAFMVITEELVARVAEAPVTATKEISLGGRKGTYYSVFDPSDTSTGFIITFEGLNAGVTGGCSSRELWQRHETIFDHIVRSIGFGGGGGPVSECKWQAFTPDPRSFAAQPGRVLPMRWDYPEGEYLVHIAEAGKYGTDPPIWLKSFGPFRLVAGGKYRALINDDANIPARAGLEPPPYLMWEEDHVTLMEYARPTNGQGRVYVRNEVPGEMFYAVCLELVKGIAGDPVIGSWSWSVPGWTVDFLPFGKLASSNGRDSNTGTWKLVVAYPRTYEVRWDTGPWVDTLSLSEDGQKLSGRNQSGAPVSATRRGSSDGGGADDPVIGSWSWSVPGWTVDFLPAGRLASSNGRDSNSGTWKLVADYPRTYEVRWDTGPWVDTLTLSEDGRTLSGRNQSGAPVSATRK